MGAVLEKALYEMCLLQDNGVDGILLENNYDLPHRIVVGPETVSAMTYLTSELVRKARVPIGVSVLWNDYWAALSIAKVCGAKFVRIPVFVDSVETRYGNVIGNALDVISFRDRIEANDVLLLTDIHVKHAKVISSASLEEATLMAIDMGSDGLIITGKWTGLNPELSRLQRVRAVAREFPVLVGSGADIRNVESLMKYADGVIVSTSLKTGQPEPGNVNVRNYRETLDSAKVKELVEQFGAVTGR
jgi:hypothetical protein